MQCHKAPQSNYLVCPQRKNDKTKCSLVGCKTKHKTAHAFLDIRATEDSVGDLYCNSYVSSREIFFMFKVNNIQRDKGYHLLSSFCVHVDYI